MSCNRPVTAYYSDVLNESGKRSLTFNPRSAYSGSDPDIPRSLTVPCGKCLGCKADQALMWSIRCYHESTLHEQNCFITLTYDNANLPSDGKICKKHLQDFFKRLRKQLSPLRIRYFACGEYGGMTRRPHYHAIIFGKDFLEGSVKVDDQLYTHKILCDAWAQGFVSISQCTMGTICYVAGYVNKKIDDADTFNLMSRRPGIGHDFLDRFSDDIVRTGCVSIEGRSYQVPKRYLDWSEDLEFIKDERREFAKLKARKQDIYAKFKDENGREINLKSKKLSKRLQEKM